YIIAFVVAGVTVILPLLEREIFPVRDAVIDFFQRFIIAFVLILPFEIRDMNMDTLRLSTIPQGLGVSRTKQLGYVLVAIFVLTEFFKEDTEIAYTVSLVALGILSVGFLKNSSEDQGKYFASFWVEAAPMFWLGVFYLINTII